MGAPVKVFLIVFVADVFFASGRLHSVDHEILFSTAQSIALRGTLSIAPMPHGFGVVTGDDGRTYGQYEALQPALSAPLVWIGEAVGQAMGPSARALAGNETDWAHAGRDPATMGERFFVSFFNSLVCPLQAAALCWFALLLTGSAAAAIATALTYGLATFALAHSRTYFTEPLATLFVFLAFTHLHLGIQKKSLNRLALAGGMAGLAALTRLDSVVAWPALVIYLGWSAMRPEPAGEKASSRARPMAAMAAFLAPMAMACVVLAALNWIRFGGPLKTGYSDQSEGVNFGSPLLVGLHGLLFSPGRGLIFFSPPLILFLWAVGSLAKSHRRLTLCLGLLVASVLCFHAKWINWSGGWCWGPRHIFLIHVFLALPIAAWLAQNAASSVRRRILAVLFAFGFAVQVYGCSQDYVGFYREMFMTPGEPNLHPLYTPAEEAMYPDTTGQPLPLRSLYAPINDSLYVPQNSCWYGYWTLAKAGRHDFLWLRLLTGREQ